jgi:hypothetical protein
MKMNITFKRSEMWTIATIAFVLLLTIVPFVVSEKTEAQTSGTSAGTMIARLTGSPIGGMVPQGFAFSTTLGGIPGSAFQTDVSNVNLPPATSLSVVVNGASVGQIVLSPTRSGTFRIAHPNGPTIIAGATVTVKNGVTEILSGVFAAPPTPTPTPTGSPTPSPSGSPSPTVNPTPPNPTPSLLLFSPLIGSTINGAMPTGFGQYLEFGTTTKTLGVFVNRVRLASGTVLHVSLNNTAIGQITLRQYGDGSLRLQGPSATIPTVIVGDTLTVKNGVTTILSGTFRLPGTTPTPSPTVSPSPTGSPTPTPTPRPARFFGGIMNSAQVVPVATGNGRGFVGISLNSAETQIRVSLGYFGLSSAASTAKIFGPAEIGTTGAEIFNLGAVTGTNGQIFNKTFDVTSAQVAQLRAGTWYAQIGTVNNPTGEIRGQIRSRSFMSSFNGNQAQDIAVFRQSSGTWYISNGDGYAQKSLGQLGDLPMSADYDGDGLTDVAVYRGGEWIILRSSDNGTTTKQFGLPTDTPVRGDFDGDGQNDLTVFRSSTGVWYSSLSSDGSFKAVQFGVDGDIPVASDLDGDGISEICVFRPSNGVWYRIESRTGQFKADQFGMAGDAPMTGDYDGDGIDDIAVFRQSSGTWYVKSSSTRGFYGVQFGANEDIPVSADFDGDGKTDISVFRPSNGFWYTLRSSDNNLDYKQFGMYGDYPTSAR